MEPELESALVRDFPTLMRDYGGDMRQTCMAWGLEIGSGWEPLFRRACEKLAALRPLVVLDQVKEKFGTIRIYYHGGPDLDVTEDIVLEAEEASARTCERCGKPGKINETGYWLSVRCPECRKEEAHG